MTLLPAADDRRTPRERILHVFEQVESQAGHPTSRAAGTWPCRSSSRTRVTPQAGSPVRPRRT
jgi:hypothetical protein